MARVRGIARVAAALLIVAAAAPATADARFKRCERDSVVRCGTVTVPLDRTGKVPGNIDVYVEQVEARDLPSVGKRSRGGGRDARPRRDLRAGRRARAAGDSVHQRLRVRVRRRGQQPRRDHLRPARDRPLRAAALPEIEQVLLLSRYPDAGEKCAGRGWATAAGSTRPTTRSRTWRPCGRRSASTRSRSTAPPTAPRSREAYAAAYPTTSSG